MLLNHVHKLGDNTSKDTVPDFESGRGYYWMKQIHTARQKGVTGNLPRMPRERTLAEQSFFGAVDRRLSRNSTVVNISFDKEGKRIHDEVF
jgi:Cu/Zn superoxide dismutase